MRQLIEIFLLAGILFHSCNPKPSIINKDYFNSDWISVSDNNFLFIEDSLLVQSFIETSDYVVEYKLSYDTLLIFTQDDEGYFSGPTSKNLVWKFRILLVDSCELSLERLFPTPIDTILFKNLNSIKKNEIEIVNLDLSTSDCFGPCPILDLKIASDSTLYQLGYGFTKHLGPFEFKLNPIDYDRIQRKLNSIKPANISFRLPGPDAQYYKLYINSGADSIKVEGNLDWDNYELKAFIFYLIQLDRLKEFKPSNEETITRFKYDDNYNRFYNTNNR